MKTTVNIRTKVIFGIALFVSVLFGFIEYQHTAKVYRFINKSEASKNRLVVETVLPVLAINLSFDLDDANQEYLRRIADKNSNIVFITLTKTDGATVFRYQDPSRENQHGITVLDQSIYDNVTKKMLGHLEIGFAPMYHDAMMKEHRALTLKFLAAVILLLAIFIVMLRHMFLPLKTLLYEIERFEPGQSTYEFNTTVKNDEVGIIQNAFAKMVQRIREYTFERKELTRSLEVKVHERTLELKRQKEALEQSNAALERKIAKIQEQEEMLITQSRLAAMGEMMSMIAHQWRQPLATMSLMITDYNVRSMLEQRDRDERDAILEKISETLSYMSDTVNDFQTYFKPNNIEEDTTLAKIIERAVQFVEARLTMNRVCLLICAHDTITVHTYVNELVQVLINLINNAVDAIKDHNSEKRWIRINVIEDETSIAITVSDSGGGIPGTILEKIFEPYFSTKSKNGTGLGLYMAKMIIEKHGKGRIGVENTDDGARFTLTYAK